MIRRITRGLIKATHYYATQQARADWDQLAQFAKAHDHGADVAELEPHDTAGHTVIDKRINALMQRLGITMPFWKWQEQQAFEELKPEGQP